MTTVVCAVCGGEVVSRLSLMSTAPFHRWAHAEPPPEDHEVERVRVKEL